MAISEIYQRSHSLAAELASPIPRYTGYAERVALTSSVLRGGAAGGAETQQFLKFPEKKQGATGITTVAPYIAGQWGRGNNRLLERLTSPEVVPAAFKYFQKFSYTVK